jgi:glycosyltransferase involved in cell wall biosynthesis
MFGEVCNTKYSIIPNGANHSIFFPLEKYKMGEKIRFISTGNFRHSIMILPLVNALESISKKGVELELLLVGPITIPEKVEILNKPFVKNIISSNQIDIADTLRGSDIFVYCLYNTPCPNSVIEAISCGLPGVGFDSGAMSELCFFNSDLLVSMPEKLFHDFLELEGNELQEKIEKCINSFKYYKQKAMEYSGFYSIDKCIERYIKVFDTVCPS